MSRPMRRAAIAPKFVIPGNLDVRENLRRFQMGGEVGVAQVAERFRDPGQKTAQYFVGHRSVGEMAFQPCLKHDQPFPLGDSLGFHASVERFDPSDLVGVQGD